jgi:uncharacterized membrane protein
MDNSVLMGFGLASSAGLNAYIPLLIIGVADRASSSFNLDRPYDFLSSTAGIVIVLMLLTIEIVVDKIPRADHINDLIQSAVRPAAGAVLFMAAVNQDDAVHPLVAMVFGLLVAGAVHWYKTTQRPAITINTRGNGNPIVSMIEDAVATIVAVLSLVLPLIGAIAAIGGAVVVRRGYRWVNNSRLGHMS